MNFTGKALKDEVANYFSVLESSNPFCFIFVFQLLKCLNY
ncbi:hypothetical protein SITYG_11980 [Streptococcus intermedius]|uniref:Uncharacterized protein n=1 Tax=Streptococcus intermedius TaxID=1338 RepID=A0AAD1FJR8_STRIT|nr:hypothetical protein SITYG_11980 [Streptococcus intermedius]